MYFCAISKSPLVFLILISRFSPRARCPYLFAEVRKHIERGEAQDEGQTRFTISLRIREKKKKGALRKAEGSRKFLRRWTTPFRISSNTRSANVTFLYARACRSKRGWIYWSMIHRRAIVRGRSQENAEGPDLKILFINNLWRRCSRPVHEPRRATRMRR